MGPDEMYPKVLRELAGVAVKPLSTSEKSWQSGPVPSAWKKGNIAPIFKKGRKGEPENCRLVSTILYACLGRSWSRYSRKQC